MENKNLVWKGSDMSLMESLTQFGYIYQYDGEDFKGFICDGLDDNGQPSRFAPFSLDNRIIDDYFSEDGDKIAKMCGVTQEEMNYERKLDAMLSYYGAIEFIPSMYVSTTLEELIEDVKDNWFGNH